MKLRSVLPLFLLMFLAQFAVGQTTKTLNFSVITTKCQQYNYCLGYVSDSPAVAADGLDEWSIYESNVQPDGSFNSGFLSIYADFDDPDCRNAGCMINFNSSSISGTDLGGYINGTASGTWKSLDGTISGTFTETFSNLKRGKVTYCGRYGCHTYPAILSGSISVTAVYNTASTVNYDKDTIADRGCGCCYACSGAGCIAVCGCELCRLERPTRAPGDTSLMNLNLVDRLR